ncbi:DNA repair protein RecN [Bacillus sp. AFS088145]|uniref:DNA repair protein RecN n=1 Tax=Bacillus sp. AFS088145 TaxID=2033514 RepID=UPI000BFA5CF6|nr:DNA repair protein RecN [Bacillus sp. AFS088145]PFH84772.1 DNA repair protein RecN [Bacillus sp. AFS088145]
MLSEIIIKNFAIIEEVSISFEKGLTVLSGETGAGKSIIIDAIGLLLGGRGSAEFVRYDTEKAEIEGLFHIENENHLIYSRCRELGFDIEDEMIILKRDITSSGKSVCRINGKLVTTSILKEIGGLLVDIHGQHESQDLMDQEHHLPMLQQYDEKTIAPLYTDYLNIFNNYTDLKKQLKQLTENEQQMAHRLDLIQFQLTEIQNANLQENEDDQLMEERLKISNFERIYKSLVEAYQSLSQDGSGLDSVRSSMYSLESVTNIDNDIKEMHEGISSSYYLLEDISYRLRDSIEQMEYDPNRLNEIETRLNEISMLKKKYGHSVVDILKYAEDIEQELDTIQHKDMHIEKLQKDLDNVTIKLISAGKTLSNKRKELAIKLTADIHKELKELYMDKTTFEIMFDVEEGQESDPILDEQHIKFKKDGFDFVEFYISTNPGEPLKPLAKVASGGELSRMFLALKSIFTKHQGITSIIFDEVDTGVSGRVAQAIAEKIHKVSIDSQVLCITHLPQVASMADTHLFIAKLIDGNRTKTSVTPLRNDQKINEIARMIAGVEITDVTIQHAKELIDQAASAKYQSQ